MSRNLKYCAIGIAILTLTALAWAGVSTNFASDPEVNDQGGGIASSTNYELHGSIGGVAMGATGVGPTASSTNFITTIGFPEGARPGSAGAAPTAQVGLGTNTPANSNELAGSAITLPMMQFVVTAGGAGNLTLNSITFTAAGTGDDLNDVTSVDLYEDVNGNGIVDGPDVGVGNNLTYSADNGTVTFGSLARGILAGSSVTYVLEYTFGTGTAATDTFNATIAVGGMAIVDGAAQPVAPAGLAITGATKTMVTAGGTPGTLTVGIGGANPSGSVDPNTAGAPWFQFTLTASTVENITVNSVKFSASGTLHDVIDLSQVRLYDDAGSLPGVVDAGDVLLAGSLAYSGDNGTINVTGLTQTVNAGSTVTWLLVYDVANSAAGGTTAAVTIAANGDITATGAASGPGITAIGAPVGSVRSITVALPTTISTPGSSGGGGCTAIPAGSRIPAGAPLGFFLPWMLLGLLLWIRRRAL